MPFSLSPVAEAKSGHARIQGDRVPRAAGRAPEIVLPTSSVSRDSRPSKRHRAVFSLVAFHFRNFWRTELTMASIS